MGSGQEKVQSVSSTEKTNALIKQFNELRLLKEKKLQERAVRSRDVETAKTAMREVVIELKQQGIGSTEELRNKIESLQSELDEELAVVSKALDGVMIHEN